MAAALNAEVCSLRDTRRGLFASVVVGVWSQIRRTTSSAFGCRLLCSQVVPNRRVTNSKVGVE